MKYRFLLLITVFFYSCHQPDASVNPQKKVNEMEPLPSVIGQIRLPDGFTRKAYPPESFANWLRELRLKSDKSVYLYNGQLKKNQSAQYAVLEMPRSSTDLQQCADVLMRLRAEYLFTQKRYSEIRFTDFEGRIYAWKESSNREDFERYLANVFGWCGSASLEKQLAPVPDFTTIEPGDVLIRGGFPGHAVMVADMAVNLKGDKIFILVQGYQPAQDMHVLVNPLKHEITPWYFIPNSDTIYTPEWIFYKPQLRRW
jgi:Domain of unknown function (4846)